MRIRLLTIPALLALVFTVGASVPANASAAAAHNCPDLYVCFYKDLRFTGQMLRLPVGDIEGTAISGPINLNQRYPQFDDQFTSGYNAIPGDYGYSVCGWEHPGGVGRAVVIPGGYELGDFRPARMDDQITSIGLC